MKLGPCIIRTGIVIFLVSLFACGGGGGDQSAAAIGYVKASNTGAGDGFGWSTALSADGSTLAVGAIHEASSAIGIDGDEADNSAADSGAVYVFTRSGRSWSQQAYVKASNTGADDYFGYSVALSADGSTLAVGANLEDSSTTGINNGPPDDKLLSSGAVYVFTRSGEEWRQEAYVKASDPAANDKFGWSTALSADGRTLAVGAWAKSSESGAVYVFTRSESDWSQQACVNAGANDQFGWSVALSSVGSTLAVGAKGESNSAGAVYVFTRSGNVWSQQAYIKASNTGQLDQFGYSVALSSDGSTLAVGAFNEDSNAIGIDGNEDDNLAADSGAAYIFTYNGSAWSQQAYIKASNTEENDSFGWSVALSEDGSALAAGALAEDSRATGMDGNEADNSADGSGAVYFFARNGSSWSQQAYVKASNTGAGDSFGCSVALSSDGNTLAVGAYGEDSGATGIDGRKDDDSAAGSGAVYLY